jgi:uncharacterized protein (TIGR02271 family)
MAQTVIGIFNSESEAQNAVSKLVNDGFNRDYIDISSNSDSYSDSLEYKDRDYDGRDRNESFGDKVSRFFSNLFDGDDDNVKRYTEVAKNGCVVTVHAQTNDEAERAVDILDLYGAVDVDEKARTFGNSSDYNRTTNYDDVNRRSDDDLTYPVGTTMDLSDKRDTYYGNTEGDDITYQNRVRNEADINNVDSDRDIIDRDIIDRDRTDRDRIDRDRNEESTFKVMEENLEVGKREVETGGVRVRSRIIEKPVEESLRLRTERVVVERNPVNRAASEADLNNFKEENFELTEHAEVPVVRKEARVVEEVRVGKEVENREETVRDTVRKTDVDIENFKSEDPRNWKDREDR